MKRFGVIGLGTFGFHLAKTLHASGMEVIAIDSNRDNIHRIKDFSTQAIEADATSRETLEAIGVQDLDVVIIGLGTNLHGSVLITLHLKEMGVKEIIAKSVNEDHAKILKKLGATDIVFPEKDIAIKIAKGITSLNILDYLTLAEGYSIIEIAPSGGFIGKSLRDLELRNKHKVQVIAIKELVPERMNMIPSPDFIIKDSDILVVMGSNEDLNKLQNLDK
ncbi:MAG: TrkA family potassium uptake protein [Nitrospinota bacterium]